MSDVLDDPRPDFLAATDWFGQVVRGVAPGQLGLPTPCEGWTVRDLLDHCVQVLRRTLARLTGAEFVPLPTGVPDDAWASLVSAADGELRAALADDDVLTRTVVTPRGETLGADLLRTYTGEFFVHAWDLATATDQESEGPADLAARTLARTQRSLPAEPRNPAAFGPVVAVAADAGPTRRLAAWMGR
ncbi:MAG: TIGR03086 family metal-binding protein [Micrococcales bacterium]|nr:TIGR03086 family metal-binding protein [Micrococcales bacterium]